MSANLFDLVVRILYNSNKDAALTELTNLLCSKDCSLQLDAMEAVSLLNIDNQKYVSQLLKEEYLQETKNMYEALSKYPLVDMIASNNNYARLRLQKVKISCVENH
jgi:hypothetical protein